MRPTAMSTALNLTRGNPVQLLLKFSVPMLVAAVIQRVYNTLDMVIVGRYLGEGAFAAVGATGCLTFLFLGFIWGLSTGLSVVTAQRYGADDMDGVRRSVATSFIVGIVATVLFMAVSLPILRPVLRLLNFPADIFEGSAVYLTVLFVGTISYTLYNTAFAMLRAIGDSVTPLIFLGVAAVLNIAANILFVAVFHWGIFGVALATVLVLFLAGAGCLWRGILRYECLRLRRSDWRLDGRFLWEHLRTAVPMALQFSITALGTLVLQAAINECGSTAIAGSTAGCQMEAVVTMPVFVVGSAIATYSAQNKGANRMDRVRVGVRACLHLLLVCSVVAAALVLVFPRTFTALFLSDATEELHGYVFQYLLWTAPYYPVLAVLVLFRNSLQGMGYPLVPFIGGVLELLARGGLSFLFLSWMGFRGACFTGPVAWFLAAALGMAYYYFHVMREPRGSVPRTDRSLRSRTSPSRR